MPPSACGVRSVVELSPQPASHHHRNHSGLFKDIRDFPLSNAHLRVTFSRYLLPPQNRPFRLLSVDTVPHPRLFATCPQERGYIYRPNPVPGAKLLVAVHTYSLPGAESATSPPWAVLPDTRRVATDQNTAQMVRELIAECVEAQKQAIRPIPRPASP